MSSDQFRQVGILLASYARPTGEVAAELGEAFLAWLEDPDGLPFEAFLGIKRECDQVHPSRFRDELCRRYVETLSEMPTSRAANLIIDRIEDCNMGFHVPEDFEPLFVVFYKQFKSLNCKLPEHRQLRRIIAGSGSD